VRDIAVAAGFLVALVLLARFGSGLVQRLVDNDDNELLTILFVGVAVLVAGVAEELGVSDAIGAFLIGLVFAATALRDRIERLVLPLRDAFAAIFFFTFGLTIKPGEFSDVVWPVMVAVAMTTVLNVVGGAVAARLGGYGRRAAAAIGLTILARGEFSLILASLALAAGLDARLGPFVGLYVLVLAVVAPILAGHPGWLARWPPRSLDRHAAVGTG
jgi:CPA2 family monovalent cation:H+ antiporter-2